MKSPRAEDAAGAPAPANRPATIRVLAACAILGGCAAGVMQADGPPASTAPVAAASTLLADGVYTYEQSRRGERLYLEVCEECHEKDLYGGGFVDEFVPPLVGEEFLAEWAPWTVGDLFEFLTTEMPPKEENREGIAAQTYTDILAYILEQNEFPAGQAELPPDFDHMVEIEFRPMQF